MLIWHVYRPGFRLSAGSSSWKTADGWNGHDSAGVDLEIGRETGMSLSSARGAVIVEEPGADARFSEGTPETMRPAQGPGGAARSRCPPFCAPSFIPGRVAV